MNTINLFLLIFALLLSPRALAPERITATLRLKGVVHNRVSLTIDSHVVLHDLPVEQGLNYQKVASLTETSTAPNGYQIIIESVNKGKLLNAHKQEDHIEYELYYDGAHLDLNEGPAVIETKHRDGSLEKDLTMTLPASDKNTEGRFTDTVIITIRPL